MTIESITISFLGVGERSRSAFQLFFESIKQVRCELIDDYRTAQLCLVDKDTYNIQQQYETLIQDYPNKYVLVLSIMEHSCAHNKEFFLKKPVKRDALHESFNRIYRLISGKSPAEKFPDESNPVVPFKRSKTHGTEITGDPQKKIKASLDDKRHKNPVESVENVQDDKVVTIKEIRKVSTANAGRLLDVDNEKYFVGQQHEKYFVGQQSDIDINDPKQLKNIFYEPNKSLQATVEQACAKSRQNKQIVQLNVLNHIFYFDAQEQKVYSAVGMAVIRPLCVIEHNNQISYSVKDDAFRNELHECFRISRDNITSKKLVKQCWIMEPFVWLVTLWCSRGRVPQGTDLTQPVYLKHWPNLTRLGSIPHAVSIAALIYDRSSTLLDVAKQLGIEQRYVFAFFSACKSLDLLGTARQDNDKLITTEKPKRNKNKSIMSKLLGKLVNYSGKSTINKVAISADEQRDSQ